MKRQRGIVLLVAIVLSVILAMFVGAALSLGSGGLALGQSSIYQAQAQQAAESGISYAIAQLRADPTWRGNKNAVTINQTELYVVEDQGNVVGLVKTPQGTWSQFRLRFNFQDGPAGGDGLNDPSLTINSPYLSVNNLIGSGPANVPRADGPGYSVTAASPVAFQTPVWSVCLAAEGRAGTGCSQLSAANPNAVTGGVNRKVIEAVYQIPNLGPNVETAASMAGNDFTVTLRPGGSGAVEVKSKDATTPTIRSKGLVRVENGDASANYRSDQGEVKSQDGNLTAVYDSTKTSVTAEALIDPFYQLAWNEVRKASSSGPKLPAGTYVWWQDGSLHYYDMSYEQYKTFITNPVNATNAGITPPPLPAEIQVDTSKRKLIITGDVYVNPTGATNELNLVPRRGAPEAPPGDPEAAGSSTPAALAGTVALDPQKVLDYLVNTQPGYWEIEDQAEVGWTTSGGSYADSDIVTVFDNGTYKWGFDPSEPGSIADAIQFTMDPTAFPGWAYDEPGNSVTPLQVSTATGVPLGDDNGIIDVPGVTDSLSAADLAIEFKPAAGGAVLSGEGDIRLTGTLSGDGGSITAGGDLRVTGLGATFSSTQGTDSVNMYAKGDILFSTLDEKTPGVFEYRDVKLKGVIYAQGDFRARLGSEFLAGAWGKLDLEGMLIAYGGDPAGAPGSNPGKGKVDLRSEDAKFTFDPVYLGALDTQPPANFQLNAISWTNHF